jgi:hypothetical protein
MAERLRRISRRTSFRAAALAACLIVAAGLVWFAPFITRKQLPIAEVPATPPAKVTTAFPVPPHGQACMRSIAITPESGIAQFTVIPAKPSASGGPPVQLVLSAPGYHAAALLGGGYTGGVATLAITPPSHPQIGRACFINAGRTPVNLIGTTEPRTISRPPTSIDGRQANGDIALTFLDARARSLGERLSEVFEHASNLTDRLVPAWLIWLLAVLVAFGLPVAVVAAFYLALREDEAGADARAV